MMHHMRLRPQHVVPVMVLSMALGALAAAPARAKPMLFPPRPDGVSEWRDERDVAPWLASWKAEAWRRERALRATATTNQQAYDVKWYDLYLAFTPGNSRVSGTVRVQATVLSAPLISPDPIKYRESAKTTIAPATHPTSKRREKMGSTLMPARFRAAPAPAC